MGFRYTTTYYRFNPPLRLGERNYTELKHHLNNIPNFTLINKEETLWSQFDRLFITLGVAGLLALFLPLTNDFFLIVKYFSAIVFSFGILTNLVDIITYNNYLRKKKKYYTRMEDCIKKSNSYTEFYNKFYK